VLLLYVIGFLAGLVAGISPCILPVLPVVLVAGASVPPPVSETAEDGEGDAAAAVSAPGNVSVRRATLPGRSESARRATSGGRSVSARRGRIRRTLIALLAHVIGHLEQQVLHAQQINGVVPKRRPIAAQDGKLSVPSERFSSDLRHVHPLRVGPGKIVDLFERRLCQRMRHRHPVSKSLPFYAKPRATGRARREALVRTELPRAGVASIYAPEVVAKSHRQLLGVGDT
jgi:hypothetical protein